MGKHQCFGSIFIESGSGHKSDSGSGSKQFFNAAWNKCKIIIFKNILNLRVLLFNVKSCYKTLDSDPDPEDP